MYEQIVVNPNDPSVSTIKRGFWFHVDRTLSAAYMPFLYKNGLTDIQPASAFDFHLGFEFISSITMSSHKFTGTPWPSGVYIMAKIYTVTVEAFVLHWFT